jgi:hypothetical protein
MAEWRHRLALDQAHISSPFGPARESIPRKLRPPSQPTNDRLQQYFDHTTQTAIRTNTADEDHLAAGPEHAGALVERCLQVWHGRNHVIRDDDVERSIGEIQMLGIHHLELLDIGEGQLRHPPLRFAEHRLGKIYADYAIPGGVAGERDPRTNTDFENPASDVLCCGDRRPPPAVEHGAKDQIVYWSPARIRLA